MKWNLPIQERFLAYVEVTDNHWFWKDKQEGARFRVTKKPSVLVNPKRGSYRFFIGEIPDKKIIISTCGVDTCIKPEHLGLRMTLNRIEIKKRSQKVARENKRKLKQGLFCIKCGENDWRCLDFHHRDPKTKKFTISGQNHSKQALMEEIAKCDVLCANCHRKEHIEF